MLVRREGWRRGREGENRELVEGEEEYWEREKGDLGLSEVGISPRDKEDKSQSSSIWVANSWVKENSFLVLMGAAVLGGVEVNSWVTDCG